MKVELERHLDDRVIYVQSDGTGFTVVECEKLENGTVNPIPLRMKTCRNLNKALETADEWEDEGCLQSQKE